jgi:hypothetical protein
VSPPRRGKDHSRMGLEPLVHDETDRCTDDAAHSGTPPNSSRLEVCRMAIGRPRQMDRRIVKNNGRQQEVVPGNTDNLAERLQPSMGGSTRSKVTLRQTRRSYHRRTEGKVEYLQSCETTPSRIGRQNGSGEYENTRETEDDKVKLCYPPQIRRCPS